mmetsp:Transcript_13834/g.33005  ORF Transcript_13834/g.33005 Transcript_13834/m.33005 type:complete len:207 (-) Transcript_13834:50-670(-)
MRLGGPRGRWRRRRRVRRHAAGRHRQRGEGDGRRGGGGDRQGEGTRSETPSDSGAEARRGAGAGVQPEARHHGEDRGRRRVRDEQAHRGSRGERHSRGSAGRAGERLAARLESPGDSRRPPVLLERADGRDDVGKANGMTSPGSLPIGAFSVSCFDGELVPMRSLSLPWIGPSPMGTYEPKRAGKLYRRSVLPQRYDSNFLGIFVV